VWVGDRGLGQRLRAGGRGFHVEGVARTNLEENDSSDSGPAVITPPLWILGFGAASAIASFVLLAIGTHWSHWAGYALGTAVTILLIALFRMKDAARTMDPRYSRVSWMSLAAAFVLLVGFLGGCANIFYLAQRVG
jgi:hypothetical protein